MLDIKLIRENPELVRAAIVAKHSEDVIDQVRHQKLMALVGPHGRTEQFDFHVLVPSSSLADGDVARPMRGKRPARHVRCIKSIILRQNASRASV